MTPSVLNRFLPLSAVVVVGAAGLLVFGTGSADAAPPPPRYGTWTFAGTTTAYTGTVDLGPGFPAVSLRSDSRTPPGASAGDPAGAISTSAVIRADSVFGAVYGSSQGQQYINLRPRADNATSPGTPSTTTYTFASPTSVGTWGVVLGDVDAESLSISGTGTDGAAVSGADLGATAFNYCGTPANATCAASQATPVPTVTAGATTVTAADPLCPPTNCNTSGAAVALQPGVALRSLTVVSTWKQGLPSYQTWFVTRTATLTGHVTTTCALPAPPRLQLIDNTGAILATTRADATGDYGFTAIAASSDYRVQVDPRDVPAGSSASAVAVGRALGKVAVPDVTVVTTVTVSGAAAAAGAGSPTLTGLAVALRTAGTDDILDQTKTGDDGSYSFTSVVPGDYTLTLTPATGEAVDPATRAVTVGCSATVVPAFGLTAPAPATPPTTTPPTTTPPTTTPPTTTPPGPPTTTTGPVESPVDDTTDTSAGNLAATGADVRWPVLAGLLLVAVGVFVLNRTRPSARRQ